MACLELFLPLPSRQHEDAQRETRAPPPRFLHEHTRRQRRGNLRTRLADPTINRPISRTVVVQRVDPWRRLSYTKFKFLCTGSTRVVRHRLIPMEPLLVMDRDEPGTVRPLRRVRRRHRRPEILRAQPRPGLLIIWLLLHP